MTSTEFVDLLRNNFSSYLDTDAGNPAYWSYNVGLYPGYHYTVIGSIISEYAALHVLSYVDGKLVDSSSTKPLMDFTESEVKNLIRSNIDLLIDEQRKDIVEKIKKL